MNAGMGWDAWAALVVVGLAVWLLVWKSQRQKACAKCEVVASVRRTQAVVAPEPARRRAAELGIGRR